MASSRGFVVSWCLLVLFVGGAVPRTPRPGEDAPWLLRDDLELLVEEPFENKQREVCSTKECKATAQTLLACMNQSVDPCVDFYKFTCGRYNEVHPLGPQESNSGVWEAMETLLDAQLREILSEPIGNEPYPVKASKLAYQSCMRTETLNDLGLKPLNNLLKQIGGWPIAQDNWPDRPYDWKRNLAFIIKRLGIYPLMSITTPRDFKDSNKRNIKLDQPSFLFIRSMLVDTITFQDQLQHYLRFIMASVKEFVKFNKIRKTDKEIKRESLQILKFEMTLASITATAETRRDVISSYNTMSLGVLQKWTDNVNVKHGHSKIRWLSFLKNIFNDTGVEIDGNEMVVVTDLDFVLKLTELIDSTPTIVIANYMGFRVVAEFARDVNDAMRAHIFELNRQITGVTEDWPKWKDCVQFVAQNLNMAVGYRYIERHFDLESKKTVQDIINNIKSEFSKQIKIIPWMDNKTKMAAIQKAENLIEFVGYPDWFENKTALEHYYKGIIITKHHFKNVVSLKTYAKRKKLASLRQMVSRSEWLLGPAEINAIYVPTMNSIQILAAILQEPIFSKNIPSSLNYGSIGSIIGHEISHAFDDQGSRFDHDGIMRDWWSSETERVYDEKTRCFVDQYSNITIAEAGNIPVNGENTLGENIADVIGLQQAYVAYQTHSNKCTPEAVLPGLEQYSPEQMFFISYASLWCGSYTPEALLHSLVDEDPHAPKMVRAWAVRNVQEFANAFNCPQNSMMNPEKKCSLW